MARMSLNRLLDVVSGDWGPMSVRETLPLIDISSPFHQQLKARMAETRRCRIPVCVYSDPGIGPWLSNGHHRVKIAYELGFRWISVTDDWEVSAGGDSGLSSYEYPIV